MMIYFKLYLNLFLPIIIFFTFNLYNIYLLSNNNKKKSVHKMCDLFIVGYKMSLFDISTSSNNYWQ
jgi:hypothetical protein